MRHLGFRKRGGAEMKYWIEHDGLRKFLHLIDSSGRPVAVVEMEIEILKGMVAEFL